MLGFMMLGFGWLVEREWATPLSRKQFHFNEQSVLMDEIGKLSVLYIDQPVGTGFSGGNEPAKNNTDATQQSYRWLTAFNARFPGLITNNSYMMGESYAAI